MTINTLRSLPRRTHDHYHDHHQASLDDNSAATPLSFRYISFDVLVFFFFFYNTHTQLAER